MGEAVLRQSMLIWLGKLGTDELAARAVLILSSIALALRMGEAVLRMIHAHMDRESLERSPCRYGFPRKVLIPLWTGKVWNGSVP